MMRTMGLQAIYRRPLTSQPAQGHKVYPYLLGVMEITRLNQVRATDITYIPMAKGFLYLVGIMNWYTRYVVAWNLSNTLDADFCIETLKRALKKGKPEVFNTDQACPELAEGAASSPARDSPSSWSVMGSESAWTGKGVTLTTYSWKDCGGR